MPSHSTPPDGQEFISAITSKDLDLSHATSASIVLAALLSGAAAASLAQAPAAGRVEQDTRPAPEPLRRPAITIDKPLMSQQAPAGSENVQFTLGSVTLSGNTALATADLAAAWQPLLGQRISLARAFDIAAAISARYRQAGYVLSQAIVPAQDLATDAPAVLRIQVLEGYVDKITITGIDPAGLLPYLAPVRAERPLKLATLERSLLLAGDLAGLSTLATLRAGSAPNAAELEIAVRRTPSNYSLAAHNRTSLGQGSLRAEAGAEWHQVLADFDRQSLRAYTSGNKRLNLLAYAGEFPIMASGLKAQLSASASKSEPSSAVASFDTRSSNLAAGLSYPVLRGRTINLGLRAGFAGYHGSSQSAGLTTSENDIRALRTGLSLDYADALGGISLLDLEWSKGLSGLGASKSGDPLLLGADPAFSKTNVYASRLQFLGGDWSLLVAVTGQASGDRLTGAEQIGLGGDVFLRAYDASEVTGDSGMAGKIELRWNLAWQTAGASLAATVYAYGDAGEVKRRQVAAPDVVSSLASAGLGIRISGPRGTRGYLELAQPIHRIVAREGNKSARAFAGVGIDF